MGLVPIATFFLPYVSYTFRDSNFVLSAYQILTSPGIRFQDYLISIPLLSKIAVVCGAAFALLAGVLVLLKKPGLAGTSFMLSAVTPLIVLMTSSSIQTAVTALGVSNIVISYQWPFLLTLILGLAAGVLSIWTQGGERLAESIFRVFACVSVGSVVIITVYMIVSGAPAIAEIGLGNFLFWHRVGAEKRHLRHTALDSFFYRRYVWGGGDRRSHRHFNRDLSVGNRP